MMADSFNCGWMWLNVAESLSSLPRFCTKTQAYTHTHWQHTMETVCKVQHAKPGWCTVTVTSVKQATELLVSVPKRTSCPEEVSAFHFPSISFSHFLRRDSDTITHSLTQQLPNNLRNVHLKLSQLSQFFSHFEMKMSRLPWIVWIPVVTVSFLCSSRVEQLDWQMWMWWFGLHGTWIVKIISLISRQWRWCLKRSWWSSVVFHVSQLLFFHYF